MIEDYLEKISELLAPRYISIPLIVLAVLLSIFFFWRKLKKVQRKVVLQGEISQNYAKHFRNINIFDILLGIFIFSLLSSRTVFLLLNTDLIGNVCWFWIPYEKIDGQIYWFRCFPWHILKFWDGGLSFEGFTAGLLISLYLSVKASTISWKSLFRPASVLLYSLLLSLEAYLALSLRSSLHFTIFTVLTVLVMIRSILNLEKLSFKYKATIQNVFNLIIWLISFTGFSLVSILLDRDDLLLNVELLDAVQLITLGIGAWMFIAGMLPNLLIKGFKKPNVKPAKGDNDSNGIFRQAKVGRSFGGAVRDGRFGNITDTAMRPRSKSQANDKRVSKNESEGTSKPDNKEQESSERSFSMSYKDFNKGWKKIIGDIKRLISKRKRLNEGEAEQSESN
jgi:hypothetical protein